MHVLATMLICISLNLRVVFLPHTITHSYDIAETIAQSLNALSIGQIYRKAFKFCKNGFKSVYENKRCFTKTEP